MYLLLLYEAVFVGTYCLAIYVLLLSILSIDIYFWFILGFIKHFLSYHIGIHTYYCKNGNACVNKDTGVKNNIIADKKYLFVDSILEGFLFVILGYYIVPLFGNNYIGVFTVGYYIHIVMEYINVHKYFCNNRCSLLTT